MRTGSSNSGDNGATEQERAELLQTVAGYRGRPGSGSRLADAAFLSRAHFQRAFHRAVGEAPGSLQRRVALERAAYALRASRDSVIAIALDAGYQTHEGFTRAFKRAFGMPPRDYRKAARRIRDLPGASGVHFDPAAASPRMAYNGPVTLKGTPPMDLTDRLITSDLAAKRGLMECARLLTDRQLDDPLAFPHALMPWVEPTRTLRESLSRLTTSGWVNVMFDRLGFAPSDTAYRTITGDSADEMRARLESYHAAFGAFVQYVKRENLWNREWVDDTCDEPHTFSIGATIEETLTWDITYRSLLIRELEAMGFSL